MQVLNTAVHAFRTMDSGAQAKTVGEMITGVHPRHWLMEPVFVPVGIILYLVLKPTLAYLCKSAKTTGKSTTFKMIALIHNILLCTYSIWTSRNVWRMTLEQASKSGLGIYCDADLWDEGVGYFGFLFYLSKYWELIDTFLLVWKQKQPSFLQVYHHAVTILCAYMLQVSHARVTFLFAGLNATVHSVMYAYYAMTVVGIRFGAKNLITIMQMVQFVTGIILATPTFWLRSGTCATGSQKVAVAGILLHAVILLGLFGQFYVKSYGTKTKAEKVQ